MPDSKSNALIKIWTLFFFKLWESERKIDRPEHTAGGSQNKGIEKLQRRASPSPLEGKKFVFLFPFFLFFFLFFLFFLFFCLFFSPISFLISSNIPLLFLNFHFHLNINLQKKKKEKKRRREREALFLNWTLYIFLNFGFLLWFLNILFQRV